MGSFDDPKSHYRDFRCPVCSHVLPQAPIEIQMVGCDPKSLSGLLIDCLATGNGCVSAEIVKWEPDALTLQAEVQGDTIQHALARLVVAVAEAKQ